MPERLSLATVATCAVLATAVFGGAYALAHDEPVEPAPAHVSPTAIRLKDDPIGELRRVSPLPALIVPPPRPEPTEPEPVVEAPPPVVPAQAPAPAPEPAPRPQAPAKKPLTFDDSG
ncbi:MAG: hypothetical protein WBC33_02690 [Conexibacter sp.]